MWPSSSLFLVRPAPLPGESLSSWRQRSAWANGYRLFPVPDERRRRVDHDLGLHSEDLRWLSDSHQVSEECVTGLTLRSHVGRLVPPLLPRRHPPWWLLSGHTGRETGMGAAYCPMCLSVDEEPYFRLRWRFAFVTACDIHGVRMVQRCPSCGASAWPASAGIKGRLSIDFVSLRHCWQCGTDLSTASTVLVEHHHVQELVRLVAMEYADLNVGRVPVRDYFTTLRLVAHLFLRSSTQAKLARVVTLPRSIIDFCMSGRARILERLSLEVRDELIPIAMDMLRAWPNRFVSVMREAGVSRVDFNPMRGAAPEWFADAINGKLAKQNRFVTQTQVRSLINTWRKDDAGAITQAKVRRLLGWQGDLSAYPELRARTHASKEEAKLFADAALRMLDESSANRRVYQHCALDLCALLTSILKARPLKEVANTPSPQIILELSALNTQYARGTPYASVVDELLVFAGSARSGPLPQVSYRQLRKRLVKVMRGLDDQLARSEVVLF